MMSEMSILELLPSVQVSPATMAHPHRCLNRDVELEIYGLSTLELFFRGFFSCR